MEENNELRFISPEKRTNDKHTFRPECLDDYIGQENVKDRIKVFIEAAKKRDEALDHVLLSGPPGLGKTTLASIIAKELGVEIRITSGPVIERAGDLASILTSLKEKDILFIDEIHRLNRTVEEVLYPAMEDYKLDIMIGKGPSARTIRLDLPHFTLIGATTRAGKLSSPLRDRFGVVNRLEYYKVDELKKIIVQAADKFDILIDNNGAHEMAKRGRGTPRIANRLLRRVRDYAEVKANGKITVEVAKNALELLDIDELGLDFIDKMLMTTIIEKFNGGPVGIDTISVSIGEESDNIYDVYEPYLIQLGFIMRTPRGRIATKKAYEHFNFNYNKKFEQGELFK